MGASLLLPYACRMKCLFPLLHIGCIAVLFAPHLSADDLRLPSGDAALIIHQEHAGGSYSSPSSYSLSFQYAGKVMTTYTPEKPLTLDVNGTVVDGTYSTVSEADGILTCTGDIATPDGCRFRITDRFLAGKDTDFELRRTVAVMETGSGNGFLNSIFGVMVDPGESWDGQEMFVPGIWYKTNFQTKMPGVLAANPEDRFFFFREDRLPLPLVMRRETSSGVTVSLLHAMSDPQTFSGDTGIARITDERMRFGSIGVRREKGLALGFMFPGSEGERNHLSRQGRDGWALRSHPIRKGIQHHYKLMFRFSVTKDYPQALSETWRHAFAIYQPKVRPVDVKQAHDGLIDTLDHYFAGEKEGYDAPGFPFSVLLPSGEARVYNYQMGFVGRQIPDAWFLIQQGIATKRADLREKGGDVVDFWAENCLLPSGLPRTWYDPSKDKDRKGTWRKADNPKGGTAMRVAATGMEGMLKAWHAEKTAGVDKPAWLAACRRFGDWLVENQNEDGSYHLSYSHDLANGKHPPTETSKATTTNPIRFLVGLHAATGDTRYRQAAERAGEYCFKNVHEACHYVGSVIDNPNVIDRESGQEAMQAFLDLHDLTGDKRWLDAAVQAANYSETWMYCQEVPAATGSGRDDFPQDRSIVGQTLIATGHSAADLGFAFSANDYYRLYLFTGDPHFLTVSRLLIHNTKQSMNWDGTLYPGLAKGLQLEAFTVSPPRRKGVMECLSWNYAAHLDPLARLHDRFGSFDIGEIEKLPLEKRRAMNAATAK